MTARGETQIAAMLERRARQYRAMIHYIDAQRQAAEGKRARAALILARHPATYRLLAIRVTGRALRAARRLLPHRALAAS
jgi:hypothetical protein